MLFLNTWRVVDSSEQGAKRMLQILSRWSPPPEVEVRGWYEFADGTGGAAIFEADSAATLLRAAAVWRPSLEIQSRALVPVEQAATISAEAVAFRDSIS
ncbi:DUF3303 family protein [Candidatus Amarobacter glycogenicus]|uniref:DUF3303 domain-containing protein n=1 Tax=Candidatus Amarobacter glycogenicus TaxID=3140699 RepID=UPI00313658C1|nr:DUF3303 family protein [Dehalococcoidia bacterium]